MLYSMIKHLHLTCVLLSITGFCLRGLWQLKKSALAGRQDLSSDRWQRWRWLPHVNDTILLLAALALTLQVDQYPFMDGWLTAKVLGLIVYIILGSVALTPGRPPRLRLGVGLLAVLVFAWIGSVALSKQVLGFLAMIPMF